jgi:nicotinamidase-related amidase
MTSTALLVMDVQQGIVDRFGGDEGYLPRLAAAAEAARGAGIVSIADWTASLATSAAG